MDPKTRSPWESLVEIAAKPDRQLGLAWVAFCLTVAVHVTDEALTGFLYIYNPTVITLRRELGFWPMPTFEFRVWLFGLITAILVGIAITPLFFRNLGWIRPFGYFVALFAGIFNALGHTIATILGHTVRAVTFRRPAPGFYSSPFLFIAACYLIVQLRRAKVSGRT